MLKKIFGLMLIVGLLLPLSGCDALKKLGNQSGSATSAEYLDGSTPNETFEAALQSVQMSSISTENQAVITHHLSQLDELINRGDTPKIVQLMTEVIAIDPNNPMANFILGTVEVNNIASNTAVKNAFNDILEKVNANASIGQSKLSNSMVAKDAVTDISLKTVLQTSTLNAAIQTLQSTLLPIFPHLNSAISCFQKVLLSKGFHTDLPISVVDKKNSGEINEMHILGVYAALNLVRAVLDQSLAYDLSFSQASYANEAEFFEKNPTFLTLKPDGRERMARASVSYQNILTAMIELIDRAPGSSYESDVDNFIGIQTRTSTVVRRLELEKWRRSLGGSPESIVIRPTPTGESFTIEMNLGNFFANPPKDFRKFLGINIAGELDESSFPTGFDFTVNGLFPYLKSYKDWQKYNYFGFRFFNPSDSTPIDSNSSTVLLTDGRVIATVANQTLTFHVVTNGSPKKAGQFNLGGYHYYWSDPYLISVDGNSIFFADSDTLYWYQITTSGVKEIRRFTLYSRIKGVHVEDGMVTIVLKDGTIKSGTIPEPNLISPGADISFDSSTKLSLSYSGESVYEAIYRNSKWYILCQQDYYYYDRAGNYYACNKDGSGLQLINYSSGYKRFIIDFDTLLEIDWGYNQFVVNTQTGKRIALGRSGYEYSITAGCGRLGFIDRGGIVVFDVRNSSVRKVGHFVPLNNSSIVSGAFDESGAWLTDGDSIYHKSF